MSIQRSQERSTHRRGATVPMFAIVLPVLVAFAALTIDVGVMYTAKADLQRAADSAALAAVARLGFAKPGDDPIARARQTAKEFVQKNQCLRETVTIADNDIVFGHIAIHPVTRQVTFTASNVTPDAARVTVRKTKASPNGALQLYFARIFGIQNWDVQASATACLLPRDIAIVADMSRSHSFDTMLQHARMTSVAMYDLWDKFPGGIGDATSVWPEDPSTLPADQLAMRAGPAWGYFKDIGFGTKTIDSNYRPNDDPGLVKLPSGANWSNAQLRTAIQNRGYSAAEVNAIMSGANDSNSYANRVAVALGLATWNSGMAGGAWSTKGMTNPKGNNNTRIESGEIQWTERFGSRTAADSGAIWTQYINNYVAAGNSEMANANSDYRYQFGIKTFLDFLQSQRSSYAATPELSLAPQQPMQAVKDAVNELTHTVYNLRGFDRMSLEIYGTQGRHELDLSDDLLSISDRLNGMQAGHYDPSTNMGAGMLRGIEELTSSRSNPSSKKIMFLLTDGYANVGCDGCTKNDPIGGKNYAISMAHQAANAGIQIFAVSVGVDSDQALMDQIAQITGGKHFHAGGTVDQYTAQLEDIFKELGGMRAASLVE
jgi:hypothetical protein